MSFSDLPTVPPGDYLNIEGPLWTWDALFSPHWGNTYFDNIYGEVFGPGGPAPYIDRRDTPVPVGVGTLPPVVGPSPSVPELVPEVNWPSPPEVFGAPVPLSDADWLIKMGLPPAVLNLPADPVSPPGWFIPQRDEELPVTIWSDIYDVADVLSGGWLPGGPMSPSFDPTSPMPVSNLNIPAPPSATPTGVPVAIPGSVIASAPACHPGGPRPVYKMVCGQYKWVYPKRRRRKALATKGDIKSLAALKGVIGGGKSLDTWIATHS